MVGLGLGKLGGLGVLGWAGRAIMLSGIARPIVVVLLTGGLHTGCTTSKGDPM